MKNIGKAKAILSYVICFSLALAVKAQSVTTIIAPSQTTESGSIIHAPVKVTAFKNIVGLQFTLEWDSTILKFVGTEDFVLGGSTQTETFGTNQASSGLLSFSWLDFSLKGKSLEDSTRLFTVIFDVIGTPSASTPLAFTDDIAIREVSDTSYTEIPSEFHNGIISVNGPTSTQVFTNAPHKVKMENAYPNPFHDYTEIRFELKNAVSAQVTIRDIQGKVIHETQQHFLSGNHTMKLTKDMFSATGIYYYTIKTADFFVTQKLIFL